MIITFVGHSHLEKTDEILSGIKKCIIDNIEAVEKEERIFFYCGGYGDFDEICRNVCCELKKEFKNSETVFITPYITLEYQKKIESFLRQGAYDSVIYPELEKVPLKFAINERNKWMINKADLVIAYVNVEYGGAYKSLKFAQSRNKNIINLGV